ncbi:unnamed protein product, partial [Effrenium voratum]
AFNFEDLWPRKDSLAVFTYQGSFTRPPCTPVVQWFLMSEPQAADEKDVLSLVSTL